MFKSALLFTGILFFTNTEAQISYKDVSNDSVSLFIITKNKRPVDSIVYDQYPDIINNNYVIAGSRGMQAVYAPSGKLIIPLKYNFILPVETESKKNPPFFIATDNRNHKTLLDHTGKIIAENFKQIELFDDKGELKIKKLLWLAVDTAGKKHLLTSTGKEIGSGYDQIDVFCGGTSLLFVSCGDDDSQTGHDGFLDLLKEREVFPCRFRYWQSLGNNIVKAGDKNNYGLINAEGMILDFIYDDITAACGKNEFSLYEDGKWGLADGKGRIIIPVMYDEELDFCKDKNKSRAVLNGEAFFIDRKNRRVN